MLPAYVKETGVDAVSLDATVPPLWAAHEVQPYRPVQGNLDPVFLLTGGAALEHATRAILETLAPRRFTISVTRTASSRCMPATNRLEKRKPNAEVSAKWRSDWLSESLMKAVLSMKTLSRQTAAAFGRNYCMNGA